MKKFIAIICCLLSAATVYADNVKDVNVVNTPDVTVTNMPDVNVANSPDVNVANVPDVIVTNDETSPIPVTIQNGGQTTVEWRYVGLTTYEDNGAFEFGGARGISAMNKACETEFGSGARASSMTEAFFRDDLDARMGWVVPGGPMLITTDGLGDHRPVHASTGFQVGAASPTTWDAANFAYCARYGIGALALYGPGIDEYGRPHQLGCLSIHPASCSAPVAIPVAP